MGIPISIPVITIEDPRKQSYLTNESNLLHAFERYKALMNKRIIQTQYNPGKLQNNPKMEYYFGYLDEHFYENLKNRAKERMMYYLFYYLLIIEMGLTMIFTVVFKKF